MTDRILNDAIHQGRRFLVTSDAVQVSDNGGPWLPVHDPGNPKSCWCGFAAVPESEADAGGNATMTRGRNWERVYTCITCRALNAPWASVQLDSAGG